MVNNDTDEHWQDVRERAAIAALQGLLTYPNCSIDYVQIAVESADALVEELKKK